MNTAKLTAEKLQVRNQKRQYVANIVSGILWFLIWSDRLSFKLAVRSTLKRSLGHNFKRLRPARNKASRIIEICRSSLWLLLLPLGICSLARLVGLPDLWFQASRDVIERTLVTALTVPIALVGVVIPFLALAVTHVYAKMGLGAIKYAFRQKAIRHLIFTSLFVLSLEFSALVAIRVLRPDVVSQEVNGALATWGNVALFFLGWWTVYLVGFAARTITQVMRSFHPESTLHLLQSDLRGESVATLSSEVRRNIGLKVLEKRCNSSIWEVSYFQPSEKPFVAAHRHGLITDISLIGLRLIPWFCRSHAKPGVSKIRIVKPHTYLAKGDTQIAAVVYDDWSEQHAPGLERLLRVMFRVSVTGDNEPDTLMEAYDQYEEATLAFVRSDNESLLRKALEGYASVLHDYLATGIRLRAEEYPNMVGDWRPFILMDSSLREIIGLATTAADGKHVGLVAHWIRSQMDSCVDDGDEYVFSRLLSQFLTLHYYSKQVNHAIGLNRAYFEPLRTLDYKLFHFGRTETVSASLAKYHVKLATLIVKHLASLLKNSIADVDVIRCKDFLRMLHPSELLGHFYPDLGTEEHEAEIELQRDDLPPAERSRLEDLLLARKAVEEFGNNTHLWYQDIQHGALEYLVDRIIHGASTVAELKDMLDVFLGGLGDIRHTAEWLERYNFGHQVFENRLWEYWPESRRGQSKNPLAAPSLVFALRALLVQRASGDTIALPPSRTIDGWKQQIEGAIEQIVNLREWEPILRGADQAVAEKVKIAVSNSVTRYKQQVAESVRQSRLDQARIDEFINNVKSSFVKSLTLPRVFAGTQERAAADELITHKVDLNLPPARYPKEAFIVQDRSEYRGWGEQEGRSLGDGVDRYIWIQIARAVLSGSVVPFQDKVEPELDRLVGQLSDADKQNTVIIIASHTMFRYEFWYNPKFKASWQLAGNREAGFYGEYLGIPVYDIHMQGAESVLFLDRRDIAIRCRSAANGGATG